MKNHLSGGWMVKEVGQRFFASFGTFHIVKHGITLSWNFFKDLPTSIVSIASVETPGTATRFDVDALSAAD